MESHKTKSEPKIVYTSDNSADTQMDMHGACPNPIQQSSSGDLPGMGIVPRPVGHLGHQGSSMMGMDDQMSKYEQMYNGQDMSLNYSLKCEVDEEESEQQASYAPVQPVLHTAKHMSSKFFDCTRCGKKLTNKHLFKEHRDVCRLNVEVPADCNMCDKTCFNKKSLYMHKLHKHNQPLAYQTEFIVYGCPYENCEFTTLFKYLWSVHKKRHSTGSKHVSKKTEHVSQSRYSCEICSKNILGKKNFYLHKFHIHSVDLNLQDEFSIFNCPYDGCTFQTLHEYLKKRHLSDHCGDSDVQSGHVKDEPKIPMESISNESISFDENEMEEVFECRICKLQSCDRYEMGAHAYQHSEEECASLGASGNTKFYQYYMCKVCPPFSLFRTRFRSTFGRHCQTQQHINRAQIRKETSFANYSLKNDSGPMQMQNMMQNMCAPPQNGPANGPRVSAFPGTPSMPGTSAMAGPSGMQAASGMQNTSGIQVNPGMPCIPGNTNMLGAPNMPNASSIHPQIVELDGSIHDNRPPRTTNVNEMASSSNTSGLNLTAGMPNQPVSMVQTPVSNLGIMNSQGTMNHQPMAPQVVQSRQMALHQQLGMPAHMPMAPGLPPLGDRPDAMMNPAQVPMPTGPSFYDDHMRQFQIRQMNDYYGNGGGMPPQMQGLQPPMSMHPQMNMGHMHGQMPPMQHMPFMNNQAPQLPVPQQTPNNHPDDNIVREVGYEDI